MEVVEAKPSSGYGKPPWVFRGSAFYQLHLVKAEKARACIPKEFKLVEAFGYTLGGFFLASYEDSPAGVFDELVVIAGLVWNRPTSCAWAARVYVNSDEACYHGRKEVGLPSQMARFSKTIEAISRQPRRRMSGFSNMIGIDDMLCNTKDHLSVQVTKVKCLDLADSCNISLTSAVPALSWMGPAVRMSLPSFSGGTEYNPNLLKYSCKIECRVQAVQPLKVSGAIPLTNGDREQSLEDHGANNHVAGDNQNDRQNLSTYVMLSKPILALKFNQMRMQVEAPIVLSHCSNSSETSIITNGTYRSIEHRAIANSEKERLSFATFYSPRHDGVVGPAASLMTEKSPARFKRIGVKDYFTGLFARKLDGKSYLYAMRIEHD